MKVWTLFVAILLGCQLMAAQEKTFRIDGSVNMPDGTDVCIVVSKYGQARTTIAETAVNNGRFVLQGAIDAPSLATLVTNNTNIVRTNNWPTDSIKWTYTDICLSPGSLFFTPNMKLTGTQLQDDFLELQSLGGLQCKNWWTFMLRHPHSSVSLFLAIDMLRRGYRLSRGQVQAMADNLLVEGDSLNWAVYKHFLNNAFNTTIGSSLVDFEITDTIGNLTTLVSAVGKTASKGTFTLIDFWASWCGICTASSKPIQDLVDDCKGRLNVVGVSIDSKQEAWRRSLVKYPSSWSQYVTTPAGYKIFADQYNIGNGVPYYLLIDDKGRVVNSPANVDELRQTMDKLLGKEVSLDEAACREFVSQLVREWKAETGNRLKSVSTSYAVGEEGFKMPLWWKVFGDKPEDGRSLYISLHGGGNAPHVINLQQWANQTALYQPKEGVYVCPRCAVDDWNMWFRPFMDSYLQNIVSWAVACMDVNPDKVYLLGYSAGGDGVWRLATRLPDQFASASMMAGHPGDVSLVNLYNLPFSLWCGANDTAYCRNKLCAERAAQLDSLQARDNSGYVHYSNIMEGKGHWLDRADTLALSWMAQFCRNPYPENIVWRQEEVCRKFFYWIGIPEEEQKRGMEVRVCRKDNVIDIEQCDYSWIDLYLCDDMVNLDKPIIVKAGDEILFNDILPRRETVMRECLASRDDIRFIFPAKLRIYIKVGSIN